MENDNPRCGDDDEEEGPSPTSTANTATAAADKNGGIEGGEKGGKDSPPRPPDCSVGTAATNGPGTKAAAAEAATRGNGAGAAGRTGEGGGAGGDGVSSAGSSSSPSASSSSPGAGAAADERARPPPQSKPSSTVASPKGVNGGGGKDDDDKHDAITDVVASLILGPDEEQRLLIEKFKATAAEAREAGREILHTGNHQPPRIVEEARRAVQTKMKAARDMWMSGPMGGPMSGGSMVTPTGVSSTSLGLNNNDEEQLKDKRLSTSMPTPPSKPMTDDAAAASSSRPRPPRHQSPVPPGTTGEVERPPKVSSSRNASRRSSVEGGAADSASSPSTTGAGGGPRKSPVTSDASSSAEDDSSDSGGAGLNRARAYGTFEESSSSSPDGTPPRRPVTKQREARASPNATDDVCGSRNDLITRSGVVWKRRSGFGKYDTKHAWERRRLILQDTKLIYFSDGGDGSGKQSPADTGFKLPATLSDLKSEFKSALPSAKNKVNAFYNHATEKAAACSFPSLDNTGMGSGCGGVENSTAGACGGEAPRGVLDLVREDATVSPTFGVGGAPTPFALSIKINGETKWKFCLDSHREQVEWLVSISNVVVRRSVEKHIEEQAASGGAGVQVTWKSLEDPSFSIHGTPRRGDDASTTATSPEGPDGKVSESGETKDDSTIGGAPSFESDDLLIVSSPRGGVVASRKDDRAGSSAPPPPSGYFVLTGRRVLYVPLLANVCMFVISPAWSSVTFWFCLVSFNVAVWLCFEGEHRLSAETRRIRSEAVMASLTSASHLPPSTVDASLRSSAAASSVAASAASVEGKLVDSSVLAPPEHVKERFVPVAGTSTVRIAEPTDEAVNGDGVHFPGWRSLTGSEMMVRSVGYEQSRKKIPSVGSLYECVAVDIFDSYSRVMDMGQKVQLPKPGFDRNDGGGADDSNGTTTKWHSPDVFIVSVAIPTEARLGSSVYDGAGFSVIIYCTMREETRRILERIAQPDYDPARDDGEKWADDEDMARKVNAVRLFEEWCRRSPSDPTFQGRFKLVPDALNLVEIGLPSYITKYKNKPVLIKRSGVTGTLYCHPGVKEFHINLHAFPYLAKQAFGYMKDNYFEKILVNVAFVIEGRNDDELPEVVIGAFQLCYPNPAYAIHADDFFRGTCPKSF